MDDKEVSERLLAWLRARLDRPDLDFAEPPRRIASGVDAALYAFSVEDAPESHRGPLVLRLFPPGASLERARREAAIQRAVVALGYPAPDSRSWGELGERPRQPFVVMDRLPGRTFQEVTMWSCAAALTASVFGFYLGWAAVAALYVGVTVRWMRRLHGYPAGRAADALGRAGLPPDALRVEARIAALADRIASLGANGLLPGLDWLRENRPVSEYEVLCHGDFWPGNLLCSRQGIAVIDWGDAALAPREYELAWSEVAFYSGMPVGGPAWLADPVIRLSRPIVRLVLSLHRVSYGALEPLGPAKMRYFTAYHCLRMLTFAAERRALGASRPEAFSSPRGWTEPEVIDLVERRFEERTGVAVSLLSPA